MKFTSNVITTLVAASHFSSTCATVNPKDDAVETSNGRLISFNVLNNDTSDKVTQSKLQPSTFLVYGYKR
jgi:hypothetical protein